MLKQPPVATSPRARKARKQQHNGGKGHARSILPPTLNHPLVRIAYKQQLQTYRNFAKCFLPQQHTHKKCFVLVRMSYNQPQRTTNERRSFVIHSSHSPHEVVLLHRLVSALRNIEVCQGGPDEGLVSPLLVPVVLEEHLRSEVVLFSKPTSERSLTTTGGLSGTTNSCTIST